MTLGEIVNGIYQLPEGKKKRDLLRWIEKFERQYSDRVLQVDVKIAKVWGELTAKGKNGGRNIPVADGLIAATAICYDLYVLTKNVKDFEPTGALVINPYV